MIKQFSELAFAVDLVSEVYNTYNPIIIAEKCEDDLDVHLTIDQIIDYYESLNIEYYKHEENYFNFYY